MLIRQAVRSGIPLILFAVAGCGDAARGNVGADTARPSPVAAPAPPGVVPARVRARTTPRRVLERARIVPASADGHAGEVICALLDVSRPTVSRWLDRYDAEGGGASRGPSPRGPAEADYPAMEAARTDATLHTPPPDQGTHWSTRVMAAQAGVHQTTVARIWRAHGVKPHLVEAFKVSTDPEFVAKLRAVVGLYVDPPKRAVVFSVDEKSQIQALN